MAMQAETRADEVVRLSEQLTLSTLAAARWGGALDHRAPEQHANVYVQLRSRGHTVAREPEAIGHIVEVLGELNRANGALESVAAFRGLFREKAPLIVAVLWPVAFTPDHPHQRGARQVLGTLTDGGYRELRAAAGRALGLVPTDARKATANLMSFKSWHVGVDRAELAGTGSDAGLPAGPTGVGRPGRLWASRLGDPVTSGQQPGQARTAARKA